MQGVTLNETGSKRWFKRVEAPVKNALSLALALLPALAGAQDWPSFRGPAASGVAEGHKTPTTWDAAKGVGLAWKTPIPGLAVSSPIVWGDTVFVTTAVSSDPNATFRHGLYGDVEPSNDVSPHSWRLLAIDKKTRPRRAGSASRTRACPRRSGIPSPARPRARRSPTARWWSRTSAPRASTPTT